MTAGLSFFASAPVSLIDWGTSALVLAQLLFVDQSTLNKGKLFNKIVFGYSPIVIKGGMWLIYTFGLIIADVFLNINILGWISSFIAYAFLVDPVLLSYQDFFL